MRSSRRIACTTAVAALLALAMCAYRAWRHVPEFYAKALAMAPVDAALASDELLRHASALTGDAQRNDRWQALFTARQINGWLAVDLPRNHANLLPAEFKDPRVEIGDGVIRVGCRWEASRLAAVCSFELSVSMLEADRIAVRVGAVRAGLVPIPLNQILNVIAENARSAGIPIEWKRVAGDPVAIVRLPPIEDDSRLFFVRSVELHDDELFVAGKTEAANVARGHAAPRRESVSQRPTNIRN